MKERILRLGRMIIGGTLGFAVGAVVGTFVLRYVSELSDTQTGWEDLTSIAASLYSFAPVGALVGVLMGGRRSVTARWAGLSTRQQTLTWGCAAATMVAGSAIALASSDPATVLALTVLATPFGAAVGLGIGTINGRGRRSIA